MQGPMIESLEELDAQLLKNSELLVLRSSRTSPRWDPGAEVFEDAREVLEDRFRVALVHCWLSAEEARTSPLFDGEVPMIHVYLGTRRLESVAAPATARETIEMIECIHSFYCDGPKILADPAVD